MLTTEDVERAIKPTSDYNAFYGRYVSKKEKAVPLSIARDIERNYREEATKYRIASGEIDRAHKELDIIGVPRNQKNTPQFPLSLAGRIRGMGADNTQLNVDKGCHEQRVPST